MLELGTREETDLELMLNGKVECEVDGHAEFRYSHDDGGAKWKFKVACPRRPGDVGFVLMCDTFHTLICEFISLDDTQRIGCSTCGSHTIGEVYVGSTPFG